MNEANFSGLIHINPPTSRFLWLQPAKSHKSIGPYSIETGKKTSGNLEGEKTIQPVAVVRKSLIIQVEMVVKGAFQ